MTEYLSLDFHTARQAKWDNGAQKHRRRPGDPFNGHLCEEIWQECLDLYNYLEEYLRQPGLTAEDRAMHEADRSGIIALAESIKARHAARCTASKP